MARLMAGLFLCLTVISTRTVLSFGSFDRATANRVNTPPMVNNRPVIGVMATETIDDQTCSDSYIMSDYVSFLQMSGARVVPIRLDENDDYYRELFMQINGVLLPGGEAFDMKSRSTEVSKFFLELAKKANDRGDYFPIVGVAQGQHVMASLFAEREVVSDCDARALVAPFMPTKGAVQSRLLQNAGDHIMYHLSTNMTSHDHEKCISMKDFTEFGLDVYFNVVSTTKDRAGVVFVQSLEANKYPFFGFQWHPERIPFQWDQSVPINHSLESVVVSQYFANVIVGEARRNTHHFSSEEALMPELIQNHDLKITPNHYMIYCFEQSEFVRNKGWVIGLFVFIILIAIILLICVISMCKKKSDEKEDAEETQLMEKKGSANY